MKKRFIRVVAYLLILCLVASVPFGVALGVEVDEEGGIWDFDAGTYTAPDGSVYQIVSDDGSDSSGSSGASGSSNSSVVADDGRIYIDEMDSPFYMDGDVNIDQVTTGMYAVNVRSGFYDESEVPVKQTAAYFDGNINVGMEQPAGDDSWFIYTTALDIESRGGMIDMTVDKSVTLDVSKSNETTQSVASAVDIDSWEYGTVNVNIGKNIEVTSDGFSTGMNVGNDWAYGEKACSTVNSTVGGDIIAEGDRGARGVYEAQIQYTDGNNGKVDWTVDVNGKIVLNAGAEEATGVFVSLVNGESDVSVGQGITAVSTEAYAKGVEEFLDDNAHSTVKIDGGITASGEYAAFGAEIYAHEDSTAGLQVKGETVVNSDKSSAIGYSFMTSGDSTVNADIQGNITVKGCSETDGFMVRTADDSKVILNYQGNIDSVSGEMGAPTDVVLVANDASGIQTAFTGDMKATNLDGEPVTAVSLESWGEDASISFDLTGNVEADSENHDGDVGITAVGISGYGGTIDATITGDVSSDGVAIAIDDETFNDDHVDLETKIDIKVLDGDVQGDTYGLYLDHENENAEINVLVDGTLSGDKAAVVLSKKSTVDNLTITVWELKSDDPDNLISRQKYDSDTGDFVLTKDTEAEKAIQYIIRIDPAQTDIIFASGTTEYEGYNVARQGDTVTMKLNIPDGYEVEAAYGDTDQAVELLQGADGNYYLVVPSGGGVMLSVKLRKKTVKTVSQAKLTRAIATIDLNGGTLNGKTGTYAMKGWLEKKLKLPGTPTKEGNTFLGWYVSEVSRSDPQWKAPVEGSADLIPGDGEVELTGDSYITAIWKEN